MCQTVSTGWVARLNALFFDRMDPIMNRMFGELKRAVFGQLEGTVREIGAGCGANLDFVQPGGRLIAVEPNRHMHPALERRAAARGVELELFSGGAEELPLADGSVDTVICSLVLCTVADPDRVLAEVRRVLRPGGRFCFVEHVAADEGSWLRRLQRLVRRPWRAAFEGCRADSAAEHHLHHAGFRSLQVHRTMVRSPFVPVWPTIAGVAVV